MFSEAGTGSTRGPDLLRVRRLDHYAFAAQGCSQGLGNMDLVFLVVGTLLGANTSPGVANRRIRHGPNVRTSFPGASTSIGSYRLKTS